MAVNPQSETGKDQDRSHAKRSAMIVDDKTLKVDVRLDQASLESLASLGKSRKRNWKWFVVFCLVTLACGYDRKVAKSFMEPLLAAGVDEKETWNISENTTETESAARTLLSSTAPEAVAKPEPAPSSTEEEKLPERTVAPAIADDSGHGAQAASGQSAEDKAPSNESTKKVPPATADESGNDTQAASEQSTEDKTPTNSMVNPNTSTDYNAFNTPGVKCRLAMEEYQNDHTDWWMENQDYPRAEWVWKFTDPKTKKPYYYGLFEILWEGGKKPTLNAIKKMWWQWEDQHGNNHTLTRIDRFSALSKGRIYFRFDATNGDTSAVPQRLWPSKKDGKSFTWKDESNNTLPVEYNLKIYTDCDRIDLENRPPPNAKIGACIAKFWGISDFVSEWITYHRMIGIQHFWMFVAEPFENLPQDGLPNEKDVTYIPYSYNHWRRHSHHTGKVRENSGKGSMNAYFQDATNNHCLYMARHFGFDWITTPDLDEYIAVHDPNIEHFGEVSPIQQFLQRYHDAAFNPPPGEQPLGQISLYGGAYRRHNTKETDWDKFKLNLDFTYRRDKVKFDSGEKRRDGNSGADGRRKNFWNAKVVNDASVHLRVDGGTEIRANISEVELCHYRTPMKGFQDPNQILHLVSYPEVRDLYRDKVYAEMVENNYAFPNLTRHIPEGKRTNGRGTIV